MHKNQSSKSGAKTLSIVIGAIFVLVLLNTWANGELGMFWAFFKTPKLQLFTILLLSILLDGLPFLLLGACISGMIEVFVSEDFLKKMFSENRFLSSIIGSCLGLVFPVCSCAIIPVGRRFIKKGVPVSGSLSFLLAAPVVNVITIFSTFIAFPGHREIVLSRVLLAFFVAVLVGYALGSTKETEILKDNLSSEDSCGTCCHEDEENESAVTRILHHTGEDFFNTGKFLILGATIAGLFQTFITKSALGIIASNPVYSIFLLGAMAIIFCLCSFVDAFVVSTFTAFSSAAKTVFMVLGPMSNLTVILLYSSIFKKRFTIKLVFWIMGSVFITAMAWEIIKRIL